jgi:hypothetical protein
VKKKSSVGTRTEIGPLVLWVAAMGLAVYLAYVAFVPSENVKAVLPPVTNIDVIAPPGGHAFAYVAAPNLSWEAARTNASKWFFHGHRGYLATIDNFAEYQFLIAKVFPPSNTDVTYLGGKQTSPGQWRWVTGPDATADNGKGRLFWIGDEKGSASGNEYATWMSTAFQHGGKWDVAKVCCVTIFSYGQSRFSTSLGNGDPEEGVAGYLVEFNQ